MASTNANGPVGADGLNDRQRVFVTVYAGNAREAARQAGYSDDKEAARRLMTNPVVVAAIRSRETAELSTVVATRQQRQAFWSAVMNDVRRPMADRLRASELLGKSEGDFLDRVESKVQHQIQLPAGMTVEDMRALARRPLRDAPALTDGQTVDGEVVADDHQP